MALSKIQTGLVKTNEIGATELNLADNFAFTGTITGTNTKLLQVGHIDQPGNGVSNSAAGTYVEIIGKTAITPVAAGSTFYILSNTMNGVWKSGISTGFFAWCRAYLYASNQSTVVASKQYHCGGYQGNNNRASQRSSATFKYTHSGSDALYLEMTGTTYDNNGTTEFGGWNQDTGWNDKCSFMYWEVAA